MTRRTAAVLIAAVALGASAAVLLSWGDSGGADESLTRFSTRGRPVEMAVPERLGPPSFPKTTGEVILIEERQGLRFLRVPLVDGSSCWASAERRSGLWHVSQSWCETGLGRFPDPKRPVVFIGTVVPELDTRLFEYQSFQGFAADGVKRIAVIDRQDRVVPVADVADNVFVAPTPPEKAKTVAALDEAGEVIWRGPGVQLPDE
jgi:hypothetical protein